VAAGFTIAVDRHFLIADHGPHPSRDHRRIGALRILARAEDIEVTQASRLKTVAAGIGGRSEEHTSELQSRENLVCRFLPEKKETAQLIIMNINKRSVMLTEGKEQKTRCSYLFFRCLIFS